MNLFKSATAERIHETITGVWDRHPDEEYRQSQSHWRGVARWNDDNAWQAVGRAARARAELAWTLAGAPKPNPLRVLEWGPGGGSLVYAFKDVASSYHGVDISEKNLAECSRMITAEGHPGLFLPVLLTGEPASVIESVRDPIGLFVSNTVFQHFPSQEYGADVLRAVRRVAAPGCMGAIQIRFDNGRWKYRGIRRLGQYAKRHLRATSYRLDEFWSLLIETGWTPLAITRIKAQTNEADFVFRSS